MRHVTCSRETGRANIDTREGKMTEILRGSGGDSEEDQSRQSLRKGWVRSGGGVLVRQWFKHKGHNLNTEAAGVH